MRFGAGAAVVLYSTLTGRILRDSDCYELINERHSPLCGLRRESICWSDGGWAVKSSLISFISSLSAPSSTPWPRICLRASSLEQQRPVYSCLLLSLGATLRVWSGGGMPDRDVRQHSRHFAGVSFDLPIHECTTYAATPPL